MTNQQQNSGGGDVQRAIRRIDDDGEHREGHAADGGVSAADSDSFEAGQADQSGGDDTRQTVLRETKAAFQAGVDAPFETPADEFLEDSFFDFTYLTEKREVERYWVNKPFSYVSILFDEDAKEYRYHVTEPTLDGFEQYVRDDIVTLLRQSLMYIDLDEEKEGTREEVFMDEAAALIREHAATVDPGTLQKVFYYLRRDFVHYGAIDPLMRDHGIEDISCDGTEVPVYIYHREYRDLQTNVSFEKRELTSFTVRLAQQAGKQLSVSSPLIDASLPDGSRLQLTMGGDVATRGANFTIRKFADIPYTPVDLAAWNTFSLEQMAYFWLAIENNRSLIFAGGTGSGKTTSMNAVSFFIPPSSKVVTIEDTREIDLPHQNWVQSVTRSSASGEGHGEVSMYNLLQAALRQRPEYLLVGEIRTEQKVALTFFQAMGTGHTAYTTVHADSIETVLNRLQNPPLSIPTGMLQDLDIVSIQRQTFIGDRRVRRNAGVYELGVDETDADNVSITPVFEWDPSDDVHKRVGSSPVLAEIAHDRGWSDAELDEEIRRRERVIEYLLDGGTAEYRAVAGTIQMYTKDPEFVTAGIEDGTLDPAALGEHVPAPDGFTEPATTTLPDTPERELWSAIVDEAGPGREHGDVTHEAPPTATDGDGAEAPNGEGTDAEETE